MKLPHYINKKLLLLAIPSLVLTVIWLYASVLIFLGSMKEGPAFNFVIALFIIAFLGVPVWVLLFSISLKTGRKESSRLMLALVSGSAKTLKERYGGSFKEKELVEDYSDQALIKLDMIYYGFMLIIAFIASLGFLMSFNY